MLLSSGFHGTIEDVDEVTVVKTVEPECILEAYLSSNHDCHSLIKSIDVSFESDRVKIYMKRAVCDLHTYMSEHEVDSHYMHFIIVEVLIALVCLHNSGVIHNDVKSENILVYEDGTVCLADLSMSTLLEWERVAPPCTPLHRPPETSWDEKVDSWAFSSMLYTMLTNEYILPGERTMGDYCSIQGRVERDDRIPEYLKTAIQGGLTLNPLDRWSSSRLLSYFDSFKVESKVNLSRLPRDCRRRDNSDLSPEEIELYKSSTS